MFGFLNTLQQLLRYQSFTHIAAIADAPQQTIRKKIYPLYKAQRKPMPHDLLVQIQSIQKNFSKLGIPLLESPGYEADDLIASLANQVRGDAQWECYIFSADKDLFQLVGENIWILQMSSDKNNGLNQIGVDQVIAKWGVPPTKIKTLLALMGDSSDNVPGVLGIGKKTAQELVQHFGTLDAIYQNLDCNKPSLRKKLSDNRDNAFLSLSLVTLQEHVDNLPEPNDLRPQRVNSQELWSWLHELDLLKMLQTFYVSNDATRKFCITDFLQPTATMLSSYSLPSVTVIHDIHEIEKLSVKESVLVLFAEEHHHSFQIIFPQQGYLLMGAIQQIQDVLSLLQKNLSPTTTCVTHDARFWIQQLEKFSINPANWIFWDILLAEYFLDSRKTNLSFTQAATLRLQVLAQWVDLVPHRSQLTLEIFYKQRELLNNQSSDILQLLQTDFTLTKVLVNMEKTGVVIDSDQLAALSTSFVQEIALLQQQIFDISGKPFNISSPKQLQEVLFTILRIDPIKKKKTGFSTDNQTLRQLLEKNPITEKIIRYRFLEKLRNTTTAALPQLLSPQTNRIHTQYHQNTVATGRLSSSNPNLQNIPIRHPEGLAIRKAFIAPPDHVLVSLDYSQVELRILAKLSRDPILLQAFVLQKDIHTQTATILFPHSSSITSHERQIAKTINFSVIYGISAHSLAQDLQIYPNQASEFIDSYFREYKQIKSYMEQVIDFAKKHGFIQTFYGRKRFIDSIQSPNANLRKRAERMAFNSVIQGTASDIIKKAMISVFDYIGPQKLAMQVHDELVFYLPCKEATRQAHEIKAIMENIHPFEDILQVEFFIGENWRK